MVRTAGRDAVYVDSGMFVTAASEPHLARLRAIGEGIAEVLARLPPDLIAVERVFVNKNLQSSLLLGEARGAALLAASAARAPLVEISALEVKQSVTGSGRAGKAQVAAMVARLLEGTPAGMRRDCTDALACALAANAMQGGLGCGRRVGVRRRGGRRR